mgnify:CR=1 FL=1
MSYIKRESMAPLGDLIYTSRNLELARQYVDQITEGGQL